MPKPYLIVITGFPGTGKSTLAAHLATKLNSVALSKDTIKEKVFDTLGTKDQAWSRQVSGTAHRIMDYIIEGELSAGRSLILESNFKPDVDSERFARFQSTYNCQLIQVLCWAQGDILFERFMERQRTTRHAGHVIEIREEQLREDFAPGKCEPLHIDAPLLEFDTTDLEHLDEESLVRDILSYLER